MSICNGDNERKLKMNGIFLSPRGITLPKIIRPAPISNSTFLFSWQTYVPNFIWKSQSMTEKMKYNNAKRSIPAHPTFVNDAHCGLHLWPVTSKINRVHPLTMVNMSAKFDEEAHNGLVSIVFTSLFQYILIVTLTFDLWPPKSIGFILSLWLTCLPSLMKKHTTV